MFCPNCGTQLDDNVRFCGGCGYKFAAVPQPETAPQPEQPPQPEAAIPPAPEPEQYAPQPQANAPEQPVYAPPPAPQQMPPPAAPAAVKRGPNPVLVFFLTFILLGAIVASIMLFWKPGYLVNKDDSSSGSESRKKDDSSEDEDDPSSETTTSVTTETVTEKITETQAPQETEPPETEPPATETEPPETEPPVTETEAPVSTPDDSSQAPNNKYSTTDRPTFDEFVWCVGQYGYVGTPPTDARRITDAKEIAGGWKCFIYYDMEESSMREINNVTIDVAENNDIVFTIDWYQADDGGEIYDETDMNDEKFYGKMSAGKLVADGIATLTIDNFWFDTSFREGQYGAGSIYSESGNVFIALMRP